MGQSCGTWMNVEAGMANFSTESLPESNHKLK